MQKKYSQSQLFLLTTLRVLIGWHFLYEGMVKLVNPNWSSVGYLIDSEGFMRGFFIWLASDPTSLKIIDVLNIWGLILIGLALILGLFERPALLGGILMLALYYLSHPPFIGLKYSLPMEGSYLVVNKILIEMGAMAVLFVFPTGCRIGIDRLIFNRKKSK